MLPIFARLTDCEGGDEGRHGSVWDRVRLYREVSVGGFPIESRTVHVFSIFVYSSNIFMTNFELMSSMPTCGTLKNSKF